MQATGRRLTRNRRRAMARRIRRNEDEIAQFTCRRIRHARARAVVAVRVGMLFLRRFHEFFEQQRGRQWQWQRRQRRLLTPAVSQATSV